MSRTIAVFAAVLLAAGANAPLAGQNHDHDPDHAVAGGGQLPAGWSVRTDRDAPTTNVKFVTMGKGYHITLGPAVVLYRASDDGKGPFHTLATFTPGAAPRHPEGYGLFYGGKALTEAGQHYTYFLIRGDGQYLIKQRDGDETKELVPWTAHAAIKTAQGKDQPSNLMEIDAKRSPGKVLFLVNGQTVHTLDATPADLEGVVGIRANHNLDLHVEGFGVHR